MTEAEQRRAGRILVVISLPQPDDLTSLVLRTDFTDDTAWEALKTALHTWEGYDSATFVSDPKYAGVSLQELVDADNAASHDDKLIYLFIADVTTMTDVERPLLAVDLTHEPGRTFRVPPRWYADISHGLRRIRRRRRRVRHVPGLSRGTDDLVRHGLMARQWHAA